MMECSWKSNLERKKIDLIKLEIFNIAYMDNTTWIANDKKSLERQLKIADKFNKFNGIKVNPEKSKLIVINSSETQGNTYVKYGLNDTIIYLTKQDESIRFLGVWISPKNNKNFVKKQIRKDIENIYNITKGKIITAKQMTYVINMVVISRIEYKANLTVFNETESRNLIAKLR